MAVAVLALVAARADAAPPQALMLGLVYSAGSGNSALARFDPLALEQLPGQSVSLGTSVGSWAFSPDGRLLAVAGASLTLRLVDLDTMTALGDVRLAARGGTVNGVTWVRQDRLLAVVNTTAGALVVAVDGVTRRVVRSTQLRRPFGYALGRLPNGLAFLLDSNGRFAAAQVAVVDADGHVRVATIGAVSIGSVQRRARGEILVRRRGAGLAVDPVGRRAYLVAADDRVAELDLDSLAVSYQRPQRQLAKAIEGSFRVARWLGGGLIAISGADYATASGRTTGTPIGVRLLDVGAWRLRILDPKATGFLLANGLVLAESSSTGRPGLQATAYGADGRERYRLDLSGSTWLTTAGAIGYACRDDLLEQIVDLSAGTVLRDDAALAAIRCPRPLSGDSPW